MSKLDELIKKYCPNGVVFKRLEDLVLRISSGLNPRQNFRLNEPEAKNYYLTVKEISSNKILFSDKTSKITDEAVKIIQKRSHLEKDDILLSGIGTIGKAVIVDIDTSNWNCSESVILIKPNKKLISPKFLLYVLLSENIQKSFTSNARGSTLKGIRHEDLCNTKIPLPPIKVQNEIVRILDSFTQFEAELTAELTLRKKQYEYYRDSLLSFDDGISSKTLSDSTNLTAGERITKAMMDDNMPYPVFGGGVFNTGNYDKYNFENSITISRAGSAGSVAYQNCKFWATDVCFVASQKNNGPLIKFVYYYLKSKETELKKHIYGGNLPKLDKLFLWNLPIPCIPLEKQKQIVKILDDFENFTNSIESGLPKEIELRHKQYEYYRNKLLTFKELKA